MLDLYVISFVVTFRSSVWQPYYISVKTKMMLKRKSDVKIGILIFYLVKKVYLYLILCALIQKLFF